MECISQSATEAKYVALAYAAKSVARCRQFLECLGFKQEKPTVIYEDCKSAVNMVSTINVNKKSQHIKNKFNYTKDLQARGEILVVHINREYQRADFIAGREVTPSEFPSAREFFMHGTQNIVKSSRKQVSFQEEVVVSDN